MAARSLALLAVLPAILLPAGAALADTTATSPTSASSVTWSDLSPGNDWTATTLDSIFPVSTGTPTAIGTMLQYLSAYAMLIAAFWITYASILQVHRTAESGKILSAHFNGWVPIRVIVALLLMIPVEQGFSVGQVLVIQVAKTGIGMAGNLTDVVADAIGPQALPIATPTVPGTRQVVMAVMQSELCMALLNLASGNPNMMVPPTIPTSASLANDQPVTIRYAQAAGDADASPTCGEISVQNTEQNEQQNTPMALGATFDLSAMTNAQITALRNLISTVRPPMQTLATTLWSTRNTSALTSMDATLSSANTSYQAALAAAATAMVSTLRTESSNGNATTDTGYVALKNLGWSGLGAYYLELSRLNGEVLAMASIVPSVTAPSWRGLGWFLTRDLAPFMDGIRQYQNEEDASISATDSASAPDGAPGLYLGASLPSSSNSVLDRILKALGITNFVMTGIVDIVASPTSGTSWTDPVAAMISLGHTLIALALIIMGGAAVMSSPVAGIVTTVVNAAVGDEPGAIATAVGTALSGVIKALLLPIFTGASLLLAPGITFAYVLPMIPYVYWIAGVAGWFILVVEAVVGVPIWAMAHLVFQGEGLHGKGNRGYEMLFSILFRPVMMIAGLLLSYAIFAPMSWLLMKSFTIATGFVFDNGYLVDNLIGLVVLLCMFASLEMSLALMCFRLISTLPHHLPAMAGMASMSRVDSDQFGDKNAGSGMKLPTDKAAKMAEDSVGAIAGGGKAPGKQTSPKPPIDATTQAYMTGAGRQEE